MSRLELEQTWRDGAPAVQKAIDTGVLQLFRGPGGVEYVRKRVLEWGREQGNETKAGIKKAFYSHK